MMFNVSNSGHSFCEIRDLPASNINNDQENLEIPIKKNIPEREADSLSDQSCYVAHVTASSLDTDAKYLPQELTSSYGLKRKCGKIVSTDKGERFNKSSSDTFYISRGLCDENGYKAGGFFASKRVKNGETSLLNFCPKESINDGTQEDKNNKPTSPNQNRFVTLTLTHDSLKNSRLYLPLSFLRENGMTEPGMVTLLGKDGTRRLANLLRERSGRMSLGKGLKDFSKANGLKIGESFTLEVIWENQTPVLRLLSTETRSHNRFLTLTLTDDSLRKCRLGLPLPFMRENGMTKPGAITLLGKDGTKWPASLLRESKGRMSLGKGWKDFAIGNGLEMGESFTLESIWEDSTPMLSLFSRETKTDGTEQGEYCAKASEKESVST